MRTIIIIFFIVIIHLAYGQDYSYYNDNKIEQFTINTKSIFIASNTIGNENGMASLVGSSFKIIKSNFDHSSQLVNKIDDQKTTDAKNIFWSEIEFHDSMISIIDYKSVLTKMKNVKGIDYVAPALYDSHNKKLLLSHLFYVKLASPNDVNYLQNVADITHTIIIGQEKYMPNWYILSAGIAATGNAIEMAKYFYETGHFSATEPDLIGVAELTSTCTNSDALFPDQWYLNNTGQQSSDQIGFDINACNAWSITAGNPNVVIGLEDNGPLLTHPDLSPNIIGSWDAENASSPSMQYSITDLTHGTSTAGILAARQNSDGISGVAPNCSLFPISLDFNNTAFDAISAAGITFGYSSPSSSDGGAGASVLSNSWTSGNITITQTTEAIANALMFGRPINGGADGYLGTVVVFAAGNDNSTPIDNNIAMSNSDILVVGATSICKERKRWWATNAQSCEDGELWGSNYGLELGVMAPGIRIETTDNSGSTGTYRADFNGTSSACPQVAGVAALILSLYPCLTQEQVTEIIEKSANKINPSMYTYASTTGEPNGTWNNEMGYGFLDAYTALNQIVNFSYLQHKDVTDVEKNYSLNFILAGYDVNINATPGNYIVDNTSNVEIKAAKYIEFEPGFTTVPGAVMLAHIAPFDNDCQNWIPPSFSHKPPQNIVGASAINDSIDFIVPDDLNSGISMQPNPFKKSFIVNFNVLFDGVKTSVKVYDLTGRLVYEQSEVEHMGNHSYDIPVNTGASLYIVEACLGDKCSTQKMVKYEMD